MEKSNLIVDCHNRIVELGSRVRVLSLSGDWLDELTLEERERVESMIGEVFSIEEIDEYGHPWVSKSWGREETYKRHFIALMPDEMEVVEGDQLINSQSRLEQGV